MGGRFLAGASAGTEGVGAVAGSGVVTLESPVPALDPGRRLELSSVLVANEGALES